VEKPAPNTYDLIVVGGGAAGFFGAICAAERKPGLKVLILEKSNKILSKVKVSGGGRCNVTHHCFDAIKLSQHYPRGEKPLRDIFKTFDVGRIVKWFESKDVALKTEDDGRMFPVTNQSQTIIDCFVNEAIRLKIKIEMGEGVTSVIKHQDQFTIYSATGKSFSGKKALIATGGSPQLHSYDWIASLGHRIVPPVPSLFTFNDSEKKFSDLMGVAVPGANVKIAGTKFLQDGPVLLTHWGLSGPAVIKLSAWAAEYLHQVQYQFTALVNWASRADEEQVRSVFSEQRKKGGKQKVISNPLFSLPQRLWVRFCELAGIEDQKIWAELSQKHQNRLMEYVIRCPFQIKGKTTFKEEFVTCGGVDLKELDLSTMESRLTSGIYFAGEVLNVDGETGGFNFQSAWSTAYVAASAIVELKAGQ
jgi:predicted Rossmann fold flavoprotein